MLANEKNFQDANQRANTTPWVLESHEAMAHHQLPGYNNFNKNKFPHCYN